MYPGNLFGSSQRLVSHLSQPIPCREAPDFTSWWYQIFRFSFDFSQKHALLSFASSCVLLSRPFGPCYVKGFLMSLPFNHWYHIKDSRNFGDVTKIICHCQCQGFLIHSLLYRMSCSHLCQRKLWRFYEMQRKLQGPEHLLSWAVGSERKKDHRSKWPKLAWGRWAQPSREPLLLHADGG